MHGAEYNAQMNTRFATDTRTDPVQAAWQRIRAHLENRRFRIQQEIVGYPSPIPACDAHFNHLLEERARISDEINRLSETAGKNAPPGEAMRLLDEFVRASRYLDDAAKREILPTQAV